MSQLTQLAYLLAPLDFTLSYSLIEWDYLLGVCCFACNTFLIRIEFDACLTKSMVSIETISFEWVNVSCKVTQMLSLSLNNLMFGSVAMYGTRTLHTNTGWIWKLHILSNETRVCRIKFVINLHL